MKTPLRPADTRKACRRGRCRTVAVGALPSTAAAAESDPFQGSGKSRHEHAAGQQDRVGQEGNSTPIELRVTMKNTDRGRLVRIHGWPLSGASWRSKRQRRCWAAGHRVITYDRRGGLGRSIQPAVGYNYGHVRVRPETKRADALNLTGGRRVPFDGHG